MPSIVYLSFVALEYFCLSQLEEISHPPPNTNHISPQSRHIYIYRLSRDVLWFYLVNLFLIIEDVGGDFPTILVNG